MHNPHSPPEAWLVETKNQDCLRREEDLPALAVSPVWVSLKL